MEQYSIWYHKDMGYCVCVRVNFFGNNVLNITHLSLGSFITGQSRVV